MDRSRIEQHIKPLIGNQQIRLLTFADVNTLQADVAAGKSARQRSGNRGGRTVGGEGVAARCISTLHSALEHAVRMGEIDTNPARGVRRIAGRPKQRRLSTTELEILGRAIHTLHTEENPIGLEVVRFLLLTGFRRQEAAALRWDWIDVEKSLVRFPDTKSGEQTRVLGFAATAFVVEKNRSKRSPYVFPADRGGGYFTATSTTLRRLCHAAGMHDVTPHTLRHTYASVAADQGFSELTISALLGHASRGITQRYVHVDEAVRLAADRVSEKVSKLLHLNSPDAAAHRSEGEGAALET